MTINLGLGAMDLMKQHSPEIPQSHLKYQCSLKIPKASFLKPFEQPVS